MRTDSWLTVSGSASAAISASTPAGTGTQLRAGTRTQGAKPPSRSTPMPRRVTQSSWAPRWQAAH